jgi:hypothetical protein
VFVFVFFEGGSIPFSLFRAFFPSGRGEDKDSRRYNTISNLKEIPAPLNISICPILFGHNSSCMYLNCKRGSKGSHIGFCFAGLQTGDQRGLPVGNCLKFWKKLVIPIKDAHHVRKILNFGDPLHN